MAELFSEDFKSLKIDDKIGIIDLDSVSNFAELRQKMGELTCKGKSSGLRFISNDTIYNLTGFADCPTSAEIGCYFRRNLLFVRNDSLVIEFGKNKRRVEVERAKAEQALLNYENTALKAFAEVENSLNNISSLKEELIAREDYFRAASNAEQLSYRRYDKGVTSYLEVLENQRSAFESELQYTQTFQELLNAYVDLYKALGGGWVSKEEMNNANNPSAE